MGTGTVCGNYMGGLAKDANLGTAGKILGGVVGGAVGGTVGVATAVVATAYVIANPKEAMAFVGNIGGIVTVVSLKTPSSEE